MTHTGARVLTRADTARQGPVPGRARRQFSGSAVRPNFADGPVGRLTRNVASPRRAGGFKTPEPDEFSLKAGRERHCLDRRRPPDGACFAGVARQHARVQDALCTAQGVRVPPLPPLPPPAPPGGSGWIGGRGWRLRVVSAAQQSGAACRLRGQLALSWAAPTRQASAQEAPCSSPPHELLLRRFLRAAISRPGHRGLSQPNLLAGAFWTLGLFCGRSTATSLGPASSDFFC